MGLEFHMSYSFVVKFRIVYTTDSPFQRRSGGGNPGRADCQRGAAQLMCR